MKALGVVRKIDSLGRVVIPKEVRDTQGWGDKQPVEMFMSDEGLVIRPYTTDREKAEILESLNGVLNYTENEQVKSIIKQAIDWAKRK